MRHWNDRSTSAIRAGPGTEGRASIEFLVFAVLALVPIVFVMQNLWAIQAATFATDQAARDAVRVFVAAPSVTTGAATADSIARRVVAEHGVSRAVSIERSCQPASNCLQPGARVTYRIRTEVTLFQVPLFAGAWPVAVPVDGEASARVSRYGGVG